MKDVKAVWIEETCIGCNRCVGAVPDVFSLPEATALIRGMVQADGVTTSNQEQRIELNAEGRELSSDIIEAAEGCPVEAIRYSCLD